MKTLGVGITAAYAANKGMVYDEKTHRPIKLDLEEMLDFVGSEMWDQALDPKGNALAATFQLIIGGHAGTAKLVQGIAMDWFNSSRRADLSVSKKEYILRAIKDGTAVRNITDLTYTKPLSLKNVQLSDVPGPLGFFGSRLTETLSDLPPSITGVMLSREDYDNMHIHKEWAQDYLIRNNWEGFLNGTAVTVGMFLPNLFSTFGNDIVKNRKNIYIPVETKKGMKEKGDAMLKNEIEVLQEQIDDVTKSDQ